MSSPAGPGAAALTALADIRGEGEAAEGRIRVVVDGTSDLVSLVLAPESMRLGADELADAIASAFAIARETAQGKARAAAAALPPAAVDAEALARLGDLGAQSMQRVEQMMAAVEQLSARLGTPPR